MPPSATFAADFSAVIREALKVDQAMERLTITPKHIVREFDRLETSFSGAEIIKQAELTSIAIDNIGGTTKLTEEELKRAGSVAKDAAAKMSALGIDVPPHIAKLAAAIDPIPQKLSLADKAAGFAKSTFAQMFGAFSAVNLVERAISSVISFGKAAIDAAGHTVDLSAKLGVSTIAVQKWEFVAKQTGATIDDFASAAFKLGIRLSGGGDSVEKSVDALGLSLAALRQQKPEAQFDALVEALGKVLDMNKRNELGVALFGKRWESIAPAVAQGYKQIADGANLASDAQLQALDKAADAWDAFVDRQEKSVQAFLGNVVMMGEGLNKSGVLTTLEGLAALGPLDVFRGIGTAVIGGAKPSGPALGPELPAEFKQTVQATAKATTDYAQALAAARKEVAALTPEQRKQIDAARELGAKVDDLADAYGVSEEAIRLYNAQTTQSVKATKETTKEIDQLWKATQHFLSEANNAEGVRRMNQDLEVLTASSSKATKELQKLAMVAVPGEVKDQLWNQGGGLIADLTKAVPAAISSQDVGKAFGTTLGDGLKFGVKSAFGNLGPIIMQALTGGGDIIKSIGGLFGGHLATSISENLGSKLKVALGETLGGALGSIIPGLGTLLGSLAGKAFSAIKGLFSGGEGAKTNDLRDKTFEAAGGFDYLNEKAAAAGITLERVLSAKRIKDFDSAWAELQMRLGEAEADQERLTKALEKYGFALEEMPKKFQQSELDKQARELIEDWRVLTAAFEGTTVVNAKMAESINDYLRTALKVGAEIPAAMKPILQSMVDQGVLVDENGEKITDLEKAGVKFSETMTQGFDRVVMKLQELIDKLNGTGAAIQNIPDVHVGVQYDDPGPPHYAEPREEEAYAMASGGRGRVSRPTLFLAGEGGPEDFAFSGANNAFGRDTGALEEKLDAIKQLLELQPLAIRDAVMSTGLA